MNTAAVILLLVLFVVAYRILSSVFRSPWEPTVAETAAPASDDGNS